MIPPSLNQQRTGSRSAGSFRTRREEFEARLPIAVPAYAAGGATERRIEAELDLIGARRLQPVTADLPLELEAGARRVGQMQDPPRKSAEVATG